MADHPKYKGGIAAVKNLEKELWEVLKREPNFGFIEGTFQARLAKAIEAGRISKIGEKLNVSDYATSAKNSIKDQMTPDHIPSFAALRKNLETKLGRPLEPLEAAELRKGGTSLLYETNLHEQFSRTYGGRNTASQITEDASDLFKAAQKDMDALRQPLLDSGVKLEDINKSFELIHEMNIKKSIY